MYYHNQKKLKECAKEFSEVEGTLRVGEIITKYQIYDS